MRYKDNNKQQNDYKSSILLGWLKFVIGLIILTGMICFFSSGYAPPGNFGQVLRHNQEYNIDASPFFFGDVENMAEYEDGVKQMRKKADEANKIEKTDYLEVQ